MRKLFIGVGIGGIFVLLILVIFLMKGTAGTIWDSPQIKKKNVATTDEYSIDSEFLDYYELGDFDTDLPVLFVNTQGNIITDSLPVMTKVSIVNADNDGQLHNICDKPDITLYASMKYRGASSNNFDKRQYKMVFFKDPNGSKKLDYDLLGMGAADGWVVNGPFLDKTLARNYLGYTLSAEIMDWAPECKYIELFVDGVYKGVYLVIEPVSQGVGRLELSDYALLSGKTAYILSRDREGTDLNPLQNYGKIEGYTNNDLYVEYPGPKNITDIEYEWINNDISAFEMALYSDYYTDEESGYAAYIDVDNFVDYFIINEVTMNHDAGDLSTFPYKEINGKLKMAVWDFNNCYDNFQWFAEDFDVFYLRKMSWFDRLLTDRNFVDKVVKRYYELRENELSVDHMYGILDQSNDILGDAIDRNFAVWGYTFHKRLLSGRERNAKSYEEADAQLRYSIIKRFNFLDEHITDLYELCNN